VLYGLGQQTRDKRIQALAPQTLHGTQLRTGTQGRQLLQGFGGINKPGLFQLDTGSGVVLDLLPQRQPLSAYDQFTFIDDFFLIRVSNDLTEMPVDATAPRH